MPGAVEISTRTVGTAGLQLPRIALGCGDFGGVGSAPQFFGQGLSDAQAAELMDAAWELGIRHFDTADAYGGGRSERAIGAWIASRGRRPQLTTKVLHPVTPGDDSGLEPERVRRAITASLERLGVERVELYLAHDVDPHVPLPATLGVFEQLRADGRITEYGVSNLDAAQLQRALGPGGPAVVQNGHSLLAPDGEALAVADRAGLAYLAHSPLSGGWLAGVYRRGVPYPSGSRMALRPEPYEGLANPQAFHALQVFAGVAAGRGMTMAGLALAWLLADDRVTQIVIGPTEPAHLDPVREALAHPLSAQERGELTTLFAAARPEHR